MIQDFNLNRMMEEFVKYYFRGKNCNFVFEYIKNIMIGILYKCIRIWKKLEF